MAELKLSFWRELYMFFMAGTRYGVFWGSTKTSLPTAIASIMVLGWKGAMLDWSHASVDDWLAAAEARSSFGSATVTEMPEPESAVRTEESVSKSLTLVMPLDLRRVTTLDGSGRLFAILP